MTPLPRREVLAAVVVAARGGRRPPLLEAPRGACLLGVAPQALEAGDCEPRAAQCVGGALGGCIGCRAARGRGGGAPRAERCALLSEFARVPLGGRLVGRRARAVRVRSGGRGALLGRRKHTREQLARLARRAPFAHALGQPAAARSFVGLGLGQRGLQLGGVAPGPKKRGDALLAPLGDRRRVAGSRAARLSEPRAAQRRAPALGGLVQQPAVPRRPRRLLAPAAQRGLQGALVAPCAHLGLERARRLPAQRGEAPSAQNAALRSCARGAVRHRGVALCGAPRLHRRRHGLGRRRALTPRRNKAFERGQSAAREAAAEVHAGGARDAVPRPHRWLSGGIVVAIAERARRRRAECVGRGDGRRSRAALPARRRARAVVKEQILPSPCWRGCHLLLLLPLHAGELLVACLHCRLGAGRSPGDAAWALRPEAAARRRLEQPRRPCGARRRCCCFCGSGSSCCLQRRHHGAVGGRDGRGRKLAGRVRPLARFGRV